MGGWSNQLHERSDGNHMDLTTTVLALTNGTEDAIVAELDICMVTHHQADAIRAAVSEATGIPVSHVRVTATHTHAAPVTSEVSGSGWMTEGLEHIDAYMTVATDKIAGAAREARSRLVPVRVGFARGSSPLGVNRRAARPDGGVRLGLNPAGPVDHTVRVVRLDDEADHAVATIVQYSAHPTILAGGNRFVSPDYPGVTRRVVESAVGGRCLFLQGTPGDIGPCETFVDVLEPVDRLGTMLGHDAAGTAMRATARLHRQRPARNQDPSTWLTFHEYEPQPPADGTLRVERRLIEAPVREDLGDPVELRTRTNALLAELRAAQMRGASDFEIRELRVQTKGASFRAERAEAIAGRASFPLEIHGLRIGPVALVGVPVEPFIELGLRIESLSPFPMTLVSGYTNGYRNYLPTAAEWARGGYEIDSSPFRPEAADLYVEAASAVLSALSA